MDANKETLVVYLTADRKDLELRHKISHHEPIDFDTHRIALNVAIIKLLNKPFQIGSVPFTRFFQLSIKWVLGNAWNPDCSSPFDLVALINNM